MRVLLRVQRGHARDSEVWGAINEVSARTLYTTGPAGSLRSLRRTYLLTQKVLQLRDGDRRNMIERDELLGVGFER